MKTGIHPKWNHQAVVTCACGSSFTTGSMQDAILVDICAKCHPFFTGEMRFVDRQGRVDRFKQKMDLAKTAQAQTAAKRQQKKSATPVVTDPTQAELSYKQLLQQEQLRLKANKKSVSSNTAAA
jgi:large subunit ribosomal protein L31